jgi:hypothetical protein
MLVVGARPGASDRPELKGFHASVVIFNRLSLLSGAHSDAVRLESLVAQTLENPGQAQPIDSAVGGACPHPTPIVRVDDRAVDGEIANAIGHQI